MRKGPLVLLFAGALACTLPSAAWAQKPRAERPTYEVGERWVMNDGVYDLIKVEKDTYVFAAGPGRQILFTKNLVPVTVLRGGSVEWEVYPPPELSWPLEVGKWGVTSAILRNRDTPAGIRVRASWEVEAYETVQVVAGTFQAFRIVHSVEVETEGPIWRSRVTPGRQWWSLVTWYAPSARMIVKAQAVGVEALNFQAVALDRPAPVQPVPAAPAPPPAGASPSLQVVISSPLDQARTEQESMALAGVASSQRGVERVLVTLNGVEVSRLEERPPRRTVGLALPIKLREGQNTLVVTAWDADGAIHQEVRTLHYDRVVPLTVVVRHPGDQARLTEEESTVAALVSSSKGVAEVSVILNGTRVLEQRERTPQRSVAVVAPVRLREGANVIVVSAREPDGTGHQEVRTVVYERPAAAGPLPAPRPPATRDTWAVVIGIGDYESPQVPALRYSLADAEAFYELLLSRAGVKKENVLLLTDKTERKPTLRNLKWALGTFLARSAKKEDLVVIFFAGHGAPEVDPRGVESDGLSKYLVPRDADPNDLYATALPMDEFQMIFDRIEAERVVVFLDACYSGAAGGRTFASKRTRASKVDDIFLERLTRSKGRAIVTASRSAEVSIELPELGHGIFTYYLVQGLRGAADLDRDGIVLLQELYQYLEQQVSQRSRAVGGNQHPVIKGELEGTLPLFRVGRR